MKYFKPFDQWPVIRTFVWILIAFLYTINLTSSHIVDKFISNSFIGSFYSDIYQGCQTSKIASAILLVTYIFSLTFIYAKGIKSKSDRIGISLILSALSLWIGFDDFWIYPTVSGWTGDFKWWLVGGLTAEAIAIMVTGYVNNMKTAENQQESNDPRGFSPDKQSFLIDTKNNQFINKLIEKLNNTDVSTTAFSLGIVGQWGTGKTVFLDSIREQIEADVNEKPIVFNPWIGLTDQSLVQSFFNSLSEKIKEDPSIELESSLQEYADALVAIEGEEGIISKALSILGYRTEKNIFELKQRITETLKTSRRNIYILIDDLDRLSAEEVYEVVKLIRITADFPHIFYIAAYDREYVESALSTYGIAESKKYLDKIFNVEVMLPKATSSQLSALFKEEISTVDSSLSEMSIEKWAKWAVKYLTTFRDIKRFVRQYGLIESHMEIHISDKEYLKQDLFLLELLKYHDMDTYVMIRDHTDKKLSFKLNSKGTFWFEIPEKETGEVQSPQTSQKLIKLLFDNENPDPRSVKYLSNFQRYFTYRLDDEVIRRSDFHRWEKSSEDESKPIFESMMKQAGTTFSLYFHLSFLSVESLTTSKLEEISIYLLPHVLHKYERGMISRTILCSLISQSYSHKDKIDTDAYFKWFKSYMDNSDLSISSKGRLFKLIRTNCPDATNQIRDLEISNFEEFLFITKPNATAMASKDTELYQLYANCIEWSHQIYHDRYTGEEVVARVGQAALFKTLIEYFQKNPSDLKSRQDFYKKMFCHLVTDDDDGVQYWEEIEEDDAEKVATDTFGSYQNYKAFYNKAFR